MKLCISLIGAIFLVLSGCASAPKINLEQLKAKAAAGDTIAMFDLGVAYDTGIQTAVDKSEAAKWYLKAAEAGNANAQNSIGSMYQAGDGVGKDMKKAAAWYQEAANKGLGEGIHNLAYLYDSGALGKADKKKALQLYTQAAEKGYMPAFYNLGLTYANGDGVPVNKVEAFKWLELGRFYTQHTYPPDSAENKHKWRIRGVIDELKKTMTPQQISQAKSLAEAWSASLKK